MITATVLTKNNQKTLKKTLDSLRPFDEVIVLDSGSTDETLKIANQYPNVTTHITPFLGFGPMHNYVSKLASNNWILSVDSDEQISSELTREISELKLDPDAVYEFKRHNYYNDKHIRWCGGWYPDHVIRLYHRKKTRFSDDLVHEKVRSSDMNKISLENPIIHTPFLEVSGFLDKIQHYSELYADQHADKPASLIQALLHGWYAFFKSYILKKGFLGGKEGFIISMYNAHSTYYKYLKISEKR